MRTIAVVTGLWLTCVVSSGGATPGQPAGASSGPERDDQPGFASSGGRDSVIASVYIRSGDEALVAGEYFNVVESRTLYLYPDGRASLSALHSMLSLDKAALGHWKIVPPGVRIDWSVKITGSGVPDPSDVQDCRNLSELRFVRAVLPSRITVLQALPIGAEAETAKHRPYTQAAVYVDWLRQATLDFGQKKIMKYIPTGSGPKTTEPQREQ